MRRLIELGVLGALVIGTFLGSYAVYFDDASDAPVSDDNDGVALYVAAEDELQSATWETEDRTLVLTPRSDDKGEYLEVTLTTREEVRNAPVVPAEPEGGPDDTAPIDDTDSPATSDLDEDIDPLDTSDLKGDTDAPAPAPVTETVETVTTFVGSERAWDLWRSFAPFQADRKLDKTKLAMDGLGLDEPYGTLTVQRKAGPVTVTFGGTTYGDRAYYLRESDDIFLLSKRSVTTLNQGAARLQERRLHPVPEDEITEVALRQGDTSVTWVQNNANDRENAHFARKDAPETRDDAGTVFLRNALRLTARASVEASEIPEDLPVVLELDVSSGSETWPVVIRAKDDEAETFYAKSPLGRGMVTLVPSQAREVLADLEQVLDPAPDGADTDAPAGDTPDAGQDD